MNTTKIYQVYHKLGLPLYDNPNYIHFYTEETFNEYNINHVQQYFNEFVAQYYVYKNHIYSTNIGFCHYGIKYFSNKQTFSYDSGIILQYNEKLNNITNLDNIVIGLSNHYDIANFKNFNYLDNYHFNIINNYITKYYPEFIERFNNLSNITLNSFLRFECFICKYEYFEKYMQFIIGLLKEYNIDLDNEITEESVLNNIDKFTLNMYSKEWWYNKKRKIAYFIEFICSIYWYLTEYDIIFNYV